MTLSAEVWCGTARRVTVNSVSALPKGLVAAGAACSVTTVDADDALGTQLVVRHHLTGI